MKYSLALSRLRQRCAPSVFPSIADDPLLDFLKQARLVDNDGDAPDDYNCWKASTAYVVGDLVVPDARNQHYYACTVAGTSGSATPNWPITSGTTIIDGGVTWQEAGEALWDGVWDINY